MSMLLAASPTVGACLQRDDFVVFESTVYPGATEEDSAPCSNLCRDCVAARTSRSATRRSVNPGDTVHRFETIVKVLSGQDARTLDIVADTYGRVTAGIHRAPSIKTAEAAKVIENTLRDLNTALMNGLWAAMP